MVSPHTTLFLALLILVPSTCPAYAQTAPSVENLWDAYQQLDYETATDAASTALRMPEQYSVGELAEIHTILGLIKYSRNDEAEARSEFISALSLDPDLQLDSLLVSPKILSFFNDVRAELDQPREDPTGPASSVRYVIVEDPRAEAALRSMLLPGWGQLHKGERRKGLVLLGAWSASVAGAAVTYFGRRSARQAYEDADTVSEAQSRYDPYNQWHQTHQAVLLGMAGVWLFSYADALLARSPDATARPLSHLHLTPASAPGTVGLHLHLRF
jgi:tetratricopeptide (TPR) repeat protein